MDLIILGLKARESQIASLRGKVPGNSSKNVAWVSVGPGTRAEQGGIQRTRRELVAL